MDLVKIRVLETLALLVIYLLAYLITRTAINHALKHTGIQRDRRKVVVKAIHLFSTLAVIVLAAGVWGLDQDQIAVFATTIITALGIAFFAHWSLLSNITASVILFFYHPLKSGDYIRVLDKDAPLEGEVVELTYFFVHLRTRSGERITIPNSLLLQRSVQVEEQGK
ncbi:MAG: mechanosensitive ion channel [Cyclobacteriaceae bacterium]|nr:mechanosensitive ion channel [Cyclobacteriaceae bacterium]